MNDWKQSLDRYLTTPPEDNCDYEGFSDTLWADILEHADPFTNERFCDFYDQNYEYCNDLEIKICDKGYDRGRSADIYAYILTRKTSFSWGKIID
jgi:hypothetical protein